MDTKVRRSTLAAALLLGSGCYNYVPVDPGAVVPANEVRVEMTRLGFAALPQIPGQPGPTLAGTLMSRENGGILLRVPVPIRQDGQVVGTVDQDVSIAVGDVLRWERREFNRARTILAVAGGIAGVAGLWAAFGSDGPPVGEEPDPPPDEEVPGLAPIRLLSLPLGWPGR